MTPPATTPRATPSTPSAVRDDAWRWCARLNTGAGQAIAAAAAAPLDYERADECVRVLESVVASARIARDSLQAPSGSPADQLGWFRKHMEEMLSAQKRAHEIQTSEWRALPGMFAKALDRLMAEVKK